MTGRLVMALAAITVMAASVLLVSATPIAGAKQPPSDQLVKVSCPSSTMCIAVGEKQLRRLAERGLGELWNGTQWVLSTKHLFAFDVTCPVSTSACVGTAGRIWLWNGSAAHSVSFPRFRDTPLGFLPGVSCASSTTCLAVGGFTDLRHLGSMFAYGPMNGTTHWIGGYTGLKQGGPFADVSCPSSTCMAVGSQQSYPPLSIVGGTYAAQWNANTGWSNTSSVSPSSTSTLVGVSCVSSSQCTAVGANNNGTTPLIETWNGTAWSVATAPSASGYLSEVSCVTATSCMTVGVSSGTAFAEQWDGTSWSIVPTANLPGATSSALSDISCPSASDCMAVGNEVTAAGKLTLAEQWNGVSWTQVPSPSP